MINWFKKITFVQILRIALGSYLVVEAFNASSVNSAILLGLGAVILLIQGVFNIGCCGVSGCASPQKKQNVTNAKEISYEEVH